MDCDDDDDTSSTISLEETDDDALLHEREETVRPNHEYAPRLARDLWENVDQPQITTTDPTRFLGCLFRADDDTYLAVELSSDTQGLVLIPFDVSRGRHRRRAPPLEADVCTAGRAVLRSNHRPLSLVPCPTYGEMLRMETLCPKYADYGRVVGVGVKARARHCTHSFLVKFLVPSRVDVDENALFTTAAQMVERARLGYRYRVVKKQTIRVREYPRRAHYHADVRFV